MALLNVVNGSGIAVIDTSYYVSLNQMELWALCVDNFLRAENVIIKVTDQVKGECYRLLTEERTDRHGLRLAKRSLEDLLGFDNSFSLSIDGETINEVSDGFLRFARKAEALRLSPGRTDVSIMRSVVQLAKEGGVVYVVTGDSDIYQTLFGLQKTYPNLEVFEPRATLERELSKYEPRYVFTGEALGKLAHADSVMDYGVVSVGHQITSNVKSDLVLDVVQKRFGVPIKLPTNLRLIPIMTVSSSVYAAGNINLDKKTAAEGQDYLVRERHDHAIKVARVNARFRTGSALVTNLRYFNAFRVEPGHLCLQGRESLKLAQYELTKAL